MKILIYALSLLYFVVVMTSCKLRYMNRTYEEVTEDFERTYLQIQEDSTYLYFTTQWRGLLGWQVDEYSWGRYCIEDNFIILLAAFEELHTIPFREVKESIDKNYLDHYRFSIYLDTAYTQGRLGKNLLSYNRSDSIVINYSKDQQKYLVANLKPQPIKDDKKGVSVEYFLSKKEVGTLKTFQLTWRNNGKSEVYTVQDPNANSFDLDIVKLTPIENYIMFDGQVKFYKRNNWTSKIYTKDLKAKTLKLKPISAKKIEQYLHKDFNSWLQAN